MANNKTPRALTDLAQLLEAGITPLDAITRLQSDNEARTVSLEHLSKELKAGRTFASAMATSGIAGSLQAAVLAAAEHSGKLSEALRFIADNAERREAHIRSLRIRLWLPNLVLFVALASHGIRKSSAGDASGALTEAAISAFSVIALSHFLLYLLGRDSGVLLSWGWRLGFHRKYKRVTDYFEQYFFTLFAWQADSGIDYVSATSAQSGLLNAEGYRKAVQRYRSQIAQGGDITTALARAGLARTPELIETLRTGEAAGRVAQALHHYLDLSAHALDRSTRQFYTWLPRCYYFVVTVIGAATLIR